MPNEAMAVHSRMFLDELEKKDSLQANHTKRKAMENTTVQTINILGRSLVGSDLVASLTFSNSLFFNSIFSDAKDGVNC